MRIPDVLMVRVALACSALGLLALGVLFYSLEPEQIDALGVYEADIGDEVSFHGRVVSVHGADGFTRIGLEGVCSFEAVAFRSFDVREGMMVSGSGVIDEYKGQRQVLIEKLVVKT